MELEVKEIADDWFKAIVSDAKAADVNALRRTLAVDVPSLAIEDVTVYDNTSALFDEVIAHRLALVPIPTEPEEFNRRDACTCGGEGCPNCIVIYTCSKEGPTTVYTGDLEPQDEAYEIPDPDIPIVRLQEGQRLMLEAVAMLGDGGQHTKWSPAVAPAFTEYPRIVVQRNGDEEEVDADALCEAHVKLRGDDDGVDVVDEDDCDLCTMDDVEQRDIRILGEPDRYIFTFETDGSMTARAALKDALGRIHDRLEAFEDRVEEID